MPGSYCYAVPKGEKGRETANKLANAVRKAGEREGVKIPKTISLLGCASLDFFISYTSNAMRDLVLSEAKRMKLVKLKYDGGCSWIPDV